MLDKLGIPRTTFYRWYDRLQIAGLEALEDQSPRPSRVWNRIPDDVRQGIVDLALDVPELSPRELAVRFTDTENYFVSEASVYRLLKSLDLITSPAFIVIKAANEFKDKTTAINQLWQTDFTYLKVIGWGRCTCRRSSMITRVISLPGSYVRPCRRAMLLRRWSLPCRHQAVIRPTSSISRDYCRITDPATSLESWLNGWVTRKWDTSGERHITRKHRARSSDGTRP